MSTVQEIKAAIDKLSLDEQAELNRLLHGWVDDEWDRQMQADARAGRLDLMRGEVDAAIRDGKLRELP